jgi:hypothetical protein
VSCVVAAQTRKGRDEGGATEKNIMHETRAFCEFEIYYFLQMV